MITTVARAKIMLHIPATDTSRDDEIEFMIPEIEGQLKALTNQTFIDADGIDSYPAGAELTAIRMIGFVTDNPDLQSESLEGYSMTKAKTDGGYPSNIEKMITCLKRPKFLSGSVPVTDRGWR